jgi:hypothetical protein
MTGRRIYNRGRREQAGAQSPHLPADLSGPVLYLRSFQEDLAASGPTSSGVAFGGLSVTTEEEQLVEALSGVGPVVTIGEPGEELPPLGAARLKFGPEEWQREVEALLRKASLVVIRPGSFSPGVQWEIQSP